MPLIVADLQDRRARAVAGTVDQDIDSAPFLNDSVDQALQVFNRLVAAGYTDPAQLGSQRLALAR
ncbi:hypothetical protein D3C78_1830160 [compost metagenome]